MLDPTSVSLIIAGMTALYATYVAINVISTTILTISKLYSYFRNWGQNNRVTNSDTNFIVRDIRTGNCSHIQGVFNKSTGEVRDMWEINATQEDKDLESKLNENPVTEILI